MASTQQLLEQVAENGTWESDSWPQVLEDILSRLDKIIRSEFPIPVLLPESPPPPQISNQLGSPPGSGEPSSQGSQTSNKENAPTNPKSPVARPPVPSFFGQTVASARHDDNGTVPLDYPPDLVALHKSIERSLRNGFPKYPPHTVQRLAELILSPRKHYRFLPAYLHALDRVVSVQSTTELFPLPYATLLSSSSSGMLNGAGATSISLATRPTPELGSDESLGGALLTPIPWLVNRSESQRSSGSGASSSSQNDRELQTSSTEMIEGPNGAGRIETVNVINGVMTPVITSQSSRSTGSVSGPTNGGDVGDVGEAHISTEEALRAEGAVTQGELLRQEQEAGVVPVQPRGLRMSERELGQLASQEATIGDDSDEQPHARGPDEIGHEDIGPQDRPVGHSGSLDLETAVGRKGRDVSLDPEDASLSDAGGGREEDMRDVDGDLEVDVDLAADQATSELANDSEDHARSAAEDDDASTGDAAVANSTPAGGDELKDVRKR